MNEKITKIIFSEKIMAFIAVAFVVTPLIIFSLFSFSQFSTTLTDLIKNETEVKSTLVANNISNFINARITDTKLISQADVLESEDFTAKNKYITDLLSENKWINHIDLIDETGIITASSGIKENKENKENKGTLFWSQYPMQKSLFVLASKATQGQVYISEAMILGNGPSVLFITPITDNNLQLISLLAIQVKLEHIADVIAIFSQGNIGNKSVYIVDNDARVIVSNDPAVTFQDSIPGYTDHLGEEVFVGYVNMTGFGENHVLNWSLITIASIDKVTAPVKQLLLVIGSIIALLSGFLAYCVVISFNNKLTSLARQELTSLAVQADEISKGNYSIDKRLESTADGVINTLVIAINRMQGNVLQTFKRLEEQKYILDSHAIVSTTDTSGLITYANDKFTETYGYSNAELIGENHRKTNSGHHPTEFFTDIWQTISSGNLWQGEICNKSRNGDLYWVFSTIGPNFDSGGEIIQYTVISTDITSIKRTDELLRRTQKMEVVAELTGGIAHDFNNLLGIIIGNIDLLKLNVEVGSPLQKPLKDTLVAALHGAEITRRLLSFSRKSDELYSPINMIDIFNEYDNFIRKSITPSITLDIHLTDDIWLVDMNPGEFEDALVNLSLNARDAMPTGGTLLFEASNKTLDDNRGDNDIDLKAGEYVEILVRDSGIGMDKDTMNNVFAPFFTTKDKGNGTGLGLSMVFGFVKRCKGNITVSSEEGLGTTFKIYLPRSQGVTDSLINAVKIDKQRLQVNQLPVISSGQRRFIGSCTDLNDIENLASHLQQSQKVDIRNKLTRAITHEFNNMLAIVLGYSELLLEQEGTVSEQIDYALEINKAGLRWAELTRELLSFAQYKAADETYNINQIIQDTHNVLRKISTASIDLNINLAKDLGLTKINVNAFEDLLLTLCIHLIDAMPNGGSLNITTANETLNSEKSNQLLVNPGDYVSVSLADTRRGMSDVLVKTVFEPFFATKQEQDPKCGLTQIHTLVLEGGGAIELKSKFDLGTQFTLYFPRDTAAFGNEPVDTSPALDLFVQTKSILIVDDEKALRVLAKSILEIDGYKIETVSGAAQALIFLETHQVDLMFTDIIMPVMNGYQLADITQELYPNMLILFTSGYHKEVEYLEYRAIYDINLLDKPYRAKDLRSRVHQMLKNHTDASKPSDI